MKLTVSCQICGRTISVVEKCDISQDDMNSYVANSSCQVDGPFQQYDEDGNPLPLDTSNIVATKTLT
jgi:hypothetical protein